MSCRSQNLPLVVGPMTGLMDLPLRSLSYVKLTVIKTSQSFQGLLCTCDCRENKKDQNRSKKDRRKEGCLTPKDHTTNSNQANNQTVISIELQPQSFQNTDEESFPIQCNSTSPPSSSWHSLPSLTPSPGKCRVLSAGMLDGLGGYMYNLTCLIEMRLFLLLLLLYIHTVIIS